SGGISATWTHDPPLELYARDVEIDDTVSGFSVVGQRASVDLEDAMLSDTIAGLYAAQGAILVGTPIKVAISPRPAGETAPEAVAGGGARIKLVDAEITGSGSLPAVSSTEAGAVDLGPAIVSNPNGTACLLDSATALGDLDIKSSLIRESSVGVRVPKSFD